MIWIKSVLHWTCWDFSPVVSMIKNMLIFFTTRNATNNKDNVATLVLQFILNLRFPATKSVYSKVFISGNDQIAKPAMLIIAHTSLAGYLLRIWFCPSLRIQLLWWNIFGCCIAWRLFAPRVYWEFIMKGGFRPMLGVAHSLISSTSKKFTSFRP